MVALLDVNVLLALAWPTHVHHAAAHQWFGANKDAGWATCVLTEASFVRLSANPAVVGSAVSIREAASVLASSTEKGRHHFWPMTTSLVQLHIAIRERLVGPKQVVDALLLDLAIRNSGRLATFDRRALSLLPPKSPDYRAIELIPA